MDSALEGGSGGAPRGAAPAPRGSAGSLRPIARRRTRGPGVATRAARARPPSRSARRSRGLSPHVAQTLRGREMAEGAPALASREKEAAQGQVRFGCVGIEVEGATQRLHRGRRAAALLLDRGQEPVGGGIEGVGRQRLPACAAGLVEAPAVGQGLGPSLHLGRGFGIWRPRSRGHGATAGGARAQQPVRLFRPRRGRRRASRPPRAPRAGGPPPAARLRGSGT